MKAEPQDEQPVFRKVAWRLIPFMGLLYLVAYLDRVNVGYAALTMNADIGLSATAFGLGSGMFFVGYFFFEVPSNLMLERLGARIWIARIMISWGVISSAMAFVTGPTTFYILRFLLGAAEAGFFPGMVLYLTYWFPGEVRARIMAAFMLAIPVSSVIGAPVSTALLETSIFGLSGWRTMFIVEGIPAVLLGISVLFLLTDRPAKAAWLNEREKSVIEAALARDDAASHGSHLSNFTQSLRSPRVWVYGLIYFGIVTGVYGLGFWGPQIIKGLGDLSLRQVGLLTALPYLLATIGMWFWGRRSDRKSERIWHLAAPAFLACAGFIAGGMSGNPVITMLALTAAVIGIHAALPVFWTLPTRFLRGTAAAGGIALINSIGNLSGYVGPYVMGLAKETTGEFATGMFILASALFGAAIITLVIGKRGNGS